MAGIGPPPKAEGKRARRNATVAMTKLPAEGRKGRTPAWPLPDDIALAAERDVARLAARRHRREVKEARTIPQRRKAETEAQKSERRAAELDAQVKSLKKLEADLWRDLWKTPQATQWEKLSWTRDVAQYVRHKVKGELGSLDDAKEARQQADRLGLTPMSLLRLRWEIEDKGTGSSSGGPRGGRSKSGGSRTRRGHLMAVGE